MKKMKRCFPREKTFVDGFEEYILDCKARNLRGDNQPLSGIYQADLQENPARRMASWMRSASLTTLWFMLRTRLAT